MALRDEKDFHFFSLDVWRFIKSILPDFSYPEFDSILIQIALPRSYREKPIFNIPLYHELGHFVDTHYQISKLSFLSLPPFSRNPKQEESHRREYFADLFAAQYVGDANWKSLEAHVGQAGASLTHPSSADRRSIAQLFLSGASVPLIDAFQAALRRQNAPELKRRFSMPNLNSTFDNMRPYELRSPAELHGLFAAGWDYFDTARRAPAGTWMSMDEASLERIINDLAEKSIRNMSIREKWGYAAAP